MPLPRGVVWAQEPGEILLAMWMQCFILLKLSVVAHVASTHDNSVFLKTASRSLYYTTRRTFNLSF